MWRKKKVQSNPAHKCTDFRLHSLIMLECHIPAVSSYQSRSIMKTASDITCNVFKLVL